MPNAKRCRSQDSTHSRQLNDPRNNGYVLAAENERWRRGRNNLSLDDLEAAQTLEALRADTTCALHENHSNTNVDPPLRSRPHAIPRPPRRNRQEVEPLLSLLSSQHPLLSSAINGSLSAYSSSKSYSPRFKYGAELVERHIGSPVATTVGTASRITGVDYATRWLYRRTESGTAENDSGQRRTINNDGSEERDVEQGLDHDNLVSPTGRRDYLLVPPNPAAGDSLPAYNADERSPAYQKQDPSMQREQDVSQPSNSTWRSQIITTTSGLGVAMSDQSLRRLRMTVSLQDLIQEYYSSSPDASSGPPTKDEHNQGQLQPKLRDQNTIFQRMESLKSDIVASITRVIGVVSNYAGGALPDNARNLVRGHVLSLPRRFFLAFPVDAKNDGAETSSSPEGSPSEPEIKSAQRVVALAVEGLDMIGQVNAIIGATVNSAEDWLDRFGRRQRDEAPCENQQAKAARQQPPEDQKLYLVTAHGAIVKFEDCDSETEIFTKKEDSMDAMQTTIKDENQDHPMKRMSTDFSSLKTTD
ncbi:MAG: hypothetical protein Q9219_004351 [cf. Caloplaca sp. 3 TL-2023]